MDRLTKLRTEIFRDLHTSRTGCGPCTYDVLRHSLIIDGNEFTGSRSPALIGSGRSKAHRSSAATVNLLIMTPPTMTTLFMLMTIHFLILFRFLQLHGIRILIPSLVNRWRHHGAPSTRFVDESLNHLYWY